jgi:hypothetical protein
MFGVALGSARGMQRCWTASHYIPASVKEGEKTVTGTLLTVWANLALALILTRAGVFGQNSRRSFGAVFANVAAFVSFVADLLYRTDNDLAGNSGSVVEILRA